MDYYSLKWRHVESSTGFIIPERLLLACVSSGRINFYLELLFYFSAFAGLKQNLRKQSLRNVVEISMNIEENAGDFISSVNVLLFE